MRSDFTEAPQRNIFQSTGIYQNESKSQCQPSRKKRVFDAENSSNNIVNHQADQQEQLTEQTHNSVEKVKTLLKKLVKLLNVSYVVPPLTLLNQPAKQKATSKAEVQLKDKY